MKKSQTTYEARPFKSEPLSKPVEPAKTSKIDQILRLLCAGVSLNRFEAERYGDHCLNSTIAELRNKYRVDIQDKVEAVPNRFGSLTRVKRYWICEEARNKAIGSRKRYNGKESSQLSMLEG